MAVLRVVHGPGSGALYQLEGERTLMGRHPNCHIVLDNGAVSRHHAQILESHGSYYVEDLRSRNGTYLNAVPVEGRAELTDGDQIRVCDIVVTFEQNGSSISDTSSGVGRQADTAFGERKTDEQPIIEDSGVYTEESQEIPLFESSSVVDKIDVRRSSDESFKLQPELKLQAVLEISRALGGELEVDAVLPKMLSTLFKIFPQAAQGFVLLKDPDTGKLHVKATRLRQGGEADAVAVSMTVVRQAMETRQALLSQNVPDDPKLNQSTSLNRLKIRSVMCAPLVGHDDEAIGVIQVVTRGKNNEFNKEDLDLLVSLATQAAMAIENATLHEALLRKRELDRDLDFATQVQLGFLPKSRPTVEHYAFADYYEAALRIGGDYFDYVMLPEGKVAVTLGDVAGKGMPAALLMARLYSSARYQLLANESPAQAVAGLNREIASSGLGHRFITFLVLVVDPAEHTVRLVNAGHLAPLLRRTDGKIEQLGRDESGLPLGIVPDLDYQESQFAIKSGETLIGYTDGVTEAMNEQREIFGRRRLEKCIADTDGDIDAVVNAIVNSVEDYVGESALRDDTCIVGLQRVS
ncbi:MAG: FHA domain-containing protein [Planctomycetota bacterium]|nr:MAG: FHA domain-containing protein [Planctomycetota bacterium]REJ94700.1 MAG: FHA domain-containing protein [Planctomycetota bacterium]REK31340.1 MAG: FHA domain-containing protein [Planctomycetota bacterium]REK39065.1 MAG: FHA domain-containing protein [Planctomycetota bacterium]